MSEADQFELMKTFFDKKLTSMKRELTDTVNEKIKTKRPRLENTTSFKYKSNEKQVEFNKEIQEDIEDVLKDITSSRQRKKIKNVIQKLTERNKLIKIADRSPARWGTVNEYLSDELASDSDDAKRIHSAEYRAIKKQSINKK